MKLIVIVPLLLMVGYLSIPFVLQLKAFRMLHRFGYKGVFTLSRVIYQGDGKTYELKISRNNKGYVTELDFQLYERKKIFTSSTFEFAKRGWNTRSLYFEEMVNAVLDFERSGYLEESTGLSLMERLPFMNSFLRDEMFKESTGTLFGRDF